jgi:hypothetical protein
VNHHQVAGLRLRSLPKLRELVDEPDSVVIVSPIFGRSWATVDAAMPSTSKR